MLSVAFVSLVLALASNASPAPVSRAQPHTINLSSRRVSSGSLTRRALSPIGVPLADYFSGTDLQYVCVMAGAHDTLAEPRIADGMETLQVTNLHACFFHG